MSKAVEKALDSYQRELIHDKNAKFGHTNKLELVRIVADEMLEHTL